MQVNKKSSVKCDVRTMENSVADLLAFSKKKHDKHE